MSRQARRSPPSPPHTLAQGRLTVDSGVPLALRSVVERCRCGTDHTRVVRHLERMSVAMTNSGASLGAGSLEADIAVMWKMMAESIYAGGDMPALAARETLQNSIDSIRLAYRSTGPYSLPKGDGEFKVTWDAAKRTLVFEDNGAGMPYPRVLGAPKKDASGRVVEGIFFALGGTGKADEPEAGGGFGAAKAVILGSSRTGEWEVWSRDKVVRSAAWIRNVMGGQPQGDFGIFEAPMRKGTQITVRGIAPESVYSKTFGETEALSVEQRLRLLLALSNIPDVRLYLNNEEIPPLFPGRRGSILEEYEQRNWGPDTVVRVKSYVRPPGTGAGAFYIRLNGLFQFSRPPGGESKYDVTVDVTTKLRPQVSDPPYPFNAARDTFSGNSRAYWTFAAVMRDFIRESASADRPKEYDTLVPDAEDEKERRGAELFADQLASVMDDPEVKAAFDELMGLASEFYKEEAKEVAPAASAEPSYDSGAELPPASAEGQDPYEGFRKAMVSLSDIDTSTETGRRELADVLKGFTASTGFDTVSAPYDYQDAVQTLSTGGHLNPAEATAVLTVMSQIPNQVAEDPEKAGESVFPVIAAANEIVKAIEREVDASPSIPEWRKADVKAKAKKSNPFGTAGMVKISRVNYDRDKARRFLKTAGKFMPYLAAWDLVLRMVAQEAKVTIAFRPGFILDDAVRAVCVSEGETGRGLKNYILIHPDPLTAMLKAHKDRPWAIANYLHTVACHEIAHLPRIGQGGGPHGHDEAWAVQREDLAVATGHLLPAFEKAVVVAFRLKPPKGKAIGKTEAAALRKRLAASEKAVRKARELEDELAKVKSEAAGQKQAREAAERRATNIDSFARDQARRIGEELASAHKQIDALHAQADRLRGVVDDRARPVRDLVAKLEALTRYRDFRDFLAGAADVRVSGELTGARLLAIIDAHPSEMAEVILESALLDKAATPAAGVMDRLSVMEALRVPQVLRDAPKNLKAVVTEDASAAFARNKKANTCVLRCMKDAATRRYAHMLGGSKDRMETFPAALAALGRAGAQLVLKEVTEVATDATPCILECAEDAFQAELDHAMRRATTRLRA